MKTKLIKFFFGSLIFLAIVGAVEAANPYITGISTTSVKAGDRVTLTGQDLVASGTDLCWKFENGRNNSYSCKYTTIVTLVGVVPPTPKGRPSYNAQIVSIESTKIVIIIPKAPAMSYDIEIGGRLENGGSVWFNRPQRVNYLAIPSPTIVPKIEPVEPSITPIVPTVTTSIVTPIEKQPDTKVNESKSLGKRVSGLFTKLFGAIKSVFKK